MATIDERVASALAFAGTVRERVILDFGVTPRDSGDILQLFNVYDKDIVEDIFTTIVTPEGAALTADIGDYSTAMVAVDADGYHDGVDLNAAAGINAKSGGAYTGGRKGYIVDNIIALLLNNAASAGKVIVEIVKLRAQT